MIYRLFKKHIDREVDRRVLANTEMEFLKSMSKLEVKDGDIIIVDYPKELPKKIHLGLKFAIEGMIREYGFDVNVIITTSGMKMSASSKEDTGIDYVVDGDSEFLKWLWARLYYLHGESPDSDYMHRILEVADKRSLDEFVMERFNNYFAK